MKKILISIAVVAVVYCGAAYMAGRVAENISHEQIEQLKAQPQYARMNPQITEYRRGIFSSAVVTSLTFPDELPTVGKPQFIMESKLRHGPLLFAKGISVGWFSATSTIRIKTNAPEFDRKIVEIFGPSIGRISALGYFNNTYDMHWNLPALEYKVGSATLSLADSNLDCEGGYRNQASSCKFVMGRLAVAAANGSKVTIAPLLMTATSTHVEDGIDLVDMEISIDEIDAQNAPKPLLMKGIFIKQTQTLKGASVDSSVAFSLASLSGPVSLERFHYTMDFDGVSKDALKRLAVLNSNMPLDPAEQNAYLVAQGKELLPLLLQNGLVIKLDTGAQYQGANPQAQWLIEYKAPADGRDVRAITDPLDYLQLADSTLLARLPTSLIPEPLVAPHLDTYITRDGSDYVLRATLKDGELTIGKTPIPRETLAAIFEKMRQAQASQQP